MHTDLLYYLVSRHSDNYRPMSLLPILRDLGPIKELEHHFLSWPVLAFEYALYVLGGRWLEGEETILRGKIPKTLYRDQILYFWVQDHPEERDEIEAKFGKLEP